MRVSRTMVVGVAALALAGARVSAAEQAEPTAVTPFMLGVISPMQEPSADWDVHGLRINLIYGSCQSIYGLDVGLVNQVEGRMKALQIGGIANHVEGVAMGLQLGLVNCSRTSINGLQIGVVNDTKRASIAQLGVFNSAEHVDGLQLGLINVTYTMIGVQLGLVNVIQDNDIPFIPVFNFYF